MLLIKQLLIDLSHQLQNCVRVGVSNFSFPLKLNSPNAEWSGWSAASCHGHGLHGWKS